MQGERKGERKGQGPGTGPSKRKSQGEGQGQSTLEGTSGPHGGSPLQEATSSPRGSGENQDFQDDGGQEPNPCAAASASPAKDSTRGNQGKGGRRKGDRERTRPKTAGQGAGEGGGRATTAANPSKGPTEGEAPAGGGLILQESGRPANEESEVPPEDQEVAVPSSAERPKTSIKEEPASSSSSSEETDDEPELTQITITPWHRRMYMQASTRIKEEPREDGLGHILCHPTPNGKKPKDAHHFLGTTIELLKHPVDEDWNPSSLEMLGKGNWRVTYALDEGPPPGRVLKLGDHGEEEAFAKEFPLLTAQVFWSGVVRLTFSAAFGKEAETVGIIQERVSLAKGWLEIAGSNSRAAYRFLVYVLVVLTSLRLKGIKVRDVGVSNLAIADPSAATPPVCFFDLGSWCRAEEAKGPSWSGFWRLCDSYIPCSKDLLVAAVARNKSSLKELKKALLWECQDYHDRLQCQGLL